MNDLQNYMMYVNKSFLGNILGKNTTQVCSNKRKLPLEGVWYTTVP